jgi:uncharacterized protein YjdB
MRIDRMKRMVLVLMAVASVAACSDPLAPGEDPTQVPSSVELTAAKTQLASIGETVQVTARVLNFSGTALSGANVTWTSSNDGVLSSQGGGTFRAVSNGSAVVRATVTGTTTPVTAEVTINVQQVAANIRVTPGEVRLWALGERQQLQASLVDAGGTALQSSPTVAWTLVSGAEFVSLAGATGSVTALKDGTAQVRATAGALSATASVIVASTVTFDRCFRLALSVAGSGTTSNSQRCVSIAVSAREGGS